jgi:hypothetical protein
MQPRPEPVEGRGVHRSRASTGLSTGLVIAARRCNLVLSLSKDGLIRQPCFDELSTGLEIPANLKCASPRQR